MKPPFTAETFEGLLSLVGSLERGHELLEQQNALLKRENAVLRARVAELERRLGLDS